MKALRLALALVVLAVVASRTPADTITFTASLTGSQETPPNGSPGSGSGTFILNSSMTSLEFHITFMGLIAGTTAAHFHDGPIGIAGPVVRGMTSADGFMSGVMFGSFNGFWNNTDAQPLSPFLVSELLAGGIYFNVHSTVFPGGEIRGQLTPVPEPSSLLLYGSGLAAMIAHRRKQLVIRLRR